MITLPVILIGLMIGLAVGTTGIGGILLAPLLAYFLGIDLHLAIATSIWSFMFTGVSGTAAYAQKGSVRWRMVGWLGLGIVPATLLGARINSLMSTTTLTIILASLIIFSGVNALRAQSSTRTSPTEKAIFSGRTLVLIGLFVGFGAALSGAGGAILLMPILLFFHFPALAAIGVSQVVQLPVAIFGSVGYLLFGQVDMGLGTVLGLVQAFGVFVGAQVAHYLPAARLRQFIAFALIGSGLFMIGRLF